MASSRLIAFSLLLTLCLVTLLYYTFLPQLQPQLDSSLSISAAVTSAEMTIRATKFTPEWSDFLKLHFHCLTSMTPRGHKLESLL